MPASPGVPPQTRAIPPGAPPPPPQGTPELPSQPIMIRIAPEPAPNEAQKLGKVIVGSFGLTGVLLIGALVTGALVASAWILWRRGHRTYDVDAPPSLGPVPLGGPTDATASPPSARDQ